MKRKVRVVLVHPPLRHVVPAATPQYVDKNRGHMPPLGLLYLQAAIEKAGHESTFLDANMEGWDHVETARSALSRAPDLVGIQAMTFTLPDAYRVAKAVKQLNRDVKVVIGGPHATIFPKETAALEDVDFAFAGEGEFNFPLFLDAFFDPEARLGIPGIASRVDGRIRYMASQKLQQNIDTIAYPARRSSRYRRYSSVLAERNPITVMITSRGCPFSCVFCNRMGRTYRSHSADYVLGEIQDILELGIGEVFIHDDTFSLDRERVKAICQGIIARRYSLIWEARTRVDSVDAELLALMRRAGCRRLSFGVESGSEKVLKSIRKGTTLEQVDRVFKWCKQEGIATLADFMFGNLDEERDDIQKSMDLVSRIRPDFVQYSICSPYPDTPLYRRGLETGVIARDIWLEFARNPLMEFQSPVWTQHFTEEELVKMTAQAYRKFYVRPAFILKQLHNIHSVEHFWTLVQGAIGMLRK